MKELLIILNEYTETTFPKDPRTLLKTPSSSNVIPMDTGHYCHMGLENVVKNIIVSRVVYQHDFSVINLFVNIDGVPVIGNSSEKGLWTILCKDYNWMYVVVSIMTKSVCRRYLSWY